MPAGALAGSSTGHVYAWPVPPPAPTRLLGEDVFEPQGSASSGVSGIPAKEIVVSTLSVLYTQPSDSNIASEEEIEHNISKRVAGSMSTPTAVAFLIFALLYLPCIATIVAIASELNWKWAIGSALYNTAIAWLLAWVGYHITLLFM